jgi:hypothetical protein
LRSTAITLLQIDSTGVTRRGSETPQSCGIS